MTTVADERHPANVDDDPGSPRGADRHADRRRPQAGRGARRARTLLDDPTMVCAEVALAAVTLALVVNIGRLFVDGEYFPKLAFTAIVAHLLAVVRRRVPMPTVVNFALPVIGGIVILTALHYGDQSAFGLPTGAVVESLHNDLAAAFGPFRTLIAPVALTPGFAVALGAAIWLVAQFADLAAFGGDAPVQAVIPHVAGFVFVSILANGRGTVSGSVTMGVAIALFLLCIRALRRSRLRWVRGEANRAAAALVLGGVAVLAVAGTLGALAEPFLPGSDSAGIVNLRKLGRQSERKLASPIVSVQNLLTEQSNEIAFQVDSDQQHYWRLTALEQPVGFRWSSADSSYSDVDGGDRLENPVADEVLGPSSEARVSVKSLSGIWLPVPYAPKRITGSNAFRFNEASSSLILATDGADLPAVEYTIEAAAPVLTDIAEINRLAEQRVGPTDIGDRYRDVPADTPTSLVEAARRVTDRADTPADQALLLQDYFRDPGNGFVYDKTADYSTSTDPFGDFLDARRGFCQQFATTFALMARVVGLPSRVAVGFTYGEPDTTVSPTRWTVRGRHAHAWPEVFISGVGWLPFEPTPDRGNPDAAYTGVGPAQDDTVGVVNGTSTGSGTTTTTVAPSTTVAPGATALPTTAAPATSTPPRRNDAQLAQPERPSRLGTAGRIAGYVLLCLTSAVLIAAGTRWLLLRRRRSRRRAELGDGPGGRVRLAWHDVCGVLTRMGMPRSPAETPNEYAARFASSRLAAHGSILGPDLVESVRRLARLETQRSYGPTPTAGEEEFAEDLAADVADRVREGQSRRERVSAGLGLDSTTRGQSRSDSVPSSGRR